MDAEGVPIDVLSQLDKDVVDDLKCGRKVTNENLIKLVNQWLNAPTTLLKGFVLDLPLYEEDDIWEEIQVPVDPLEQEKAEKENYVEPVEPVVVVEPEVKQPTE